MLRGPNSLFHSFKETPLRLAGTLPRQREHEISECSDCLGKDMTLVSLIGLSRL